MLPKLFMCGAYLLAVVTVSNEFETQKGIELGCNQEINITEEILSCSTVIENEAVAFSASDEHDVLLSVIDESGEERLLLSQVEGEQETLVALITETTELHACNEEINSQLHACNDEEISLMIV